MPLKVIKMANNSDSKNSCSEIKDTGYCSFNKGKLAPACELCVKGRKSVLYITGVCPRKCFYCPVSQKKKDIDVKYINERKYESNEDLLDEIRKSQSKGVGITGGDPLSRLQRTVDTIKLLKKEFGQDFHCHLYTSLNLVTKETLQKLYDAGLDEIRFHPDLEDDKLWWKIPLGKEHDWKFGIEIPCIPDKKDMISKLIIEHKDNVDYFNLNEFEISDLNAQAFQDHGYKPVDDISYAIKDSKEVAFELMKLCENVHFCTCTLKDKVQMGNRLKLRAESVAKEYDFVDDEGMLIRGAIYLNAIPDKTYKEVYKGIDKEEEIKLLEKLRLELIEEFELPEELIELDTQKLRLLTLPEFVEEFAQDLEQRCAIVKEYPTFDHMEVELDFLN